MYIFEKEQKALYMKHKTQGGFSNLFYGSSLVNNSNSSSNNDDKNIISTLRFANIEIHDIK
eukprot:5907357-Amphidinium_carterae.1